MGDPIPTRIVDITPEMVSAALEQNGINATVSAGNVEPIGTGEGFLGELARLHLEYTDEGTAGPGTLVAKIPTGDEGLKPLGIMLGVYESEARFYNELASDVQIRVPRCFYNEWDNDSENYALLLEDMGHLTAGDQAAGASLDQARAAMSAAAGVHGRWWRNETITRSDWIRRIDPTNGPSSCSIGSWRGSRPRPAIMLCGSTSATSRSTRSCDPRAAGPSCD